MASLLVLIPTQHLHITLVQLQLIGRYAQRSLSYQRVTEDEVFKPRFGPAQAPKNTFPMTKSIALTLSAL